jgi:hypothetical protein
MKALQKTTTNREREHHKNLQTERRKHYGHYQRRIIQHI